MVPKIVEPWGYLNEYVWSWNYKYVYKHNEIDSEDMKKATPLIP